MFTDSRLESSTVYPAVEWSRFFLSTARGFCGRKATTMQWNFSTNYLSNNGGLSIFTVSAVSPRHDD